jgi:hypothetical protein
MAPERARDLAFVFVPLEDLVPYDRNTKLHPAAQVEEIKNSIRHFGFTNPIVADLEDGGVIAAGHGRRLALLEMFEAGEEVRLPDGQEVPTGHALVIDCSSWTEAQRRAYALADNKIAENAGWDYDLLKAEIGDLLDLADEDAPLLGFSEDELQLAMGEEDPGAFLNDLATGETKQEDAGETPAAAKSSSGVSITFTVSPEERDMIIDWLNGIRKEHGLKTAASALATIARQSLQQ